MASSAPPPRQWPCTAAIVTFFEPTSGANDAVKLGQHLLNFVRSVGGDVHARGKRLLRTAEITIEISGRASISASASARFFHHRNVDDVERRIAADAMRATGGWHSRRLVIARQNSTCSAHASVYFVQKPSLSYSRMAFNSAALGSGVSCNLVAYSQLPSCVVAAHRPLRFRDATEARYASPSSPKRSTALVVITADGPPRGRPTRLRQPGPSPLPGLVTYETRSGKRCLLCSSKSHKSMRE